MIGMYVETPHELGSYFKFKANIKHDLHKKSDLIGNDSSKFAQALLIESLIAFLNALAQVHANSDVSVEVKRGSIGVSGYISFWFTDMWEPAIEAMDKLNAICVEFADKYPHSSFSVTCKQHTKLLEVVT